jgi:hypothetical protein
VNYGFGLNAQWSGLMRRYSSRDWHNIPVCDGGSIYGFTSGSLTRSAINEDVYLNRWTVDNPNPNAKYPRLDIQNNQNNNRTSTFRMHDASFLRLKNAEIGYTLPRKVTENFYVSNLRVLHVRRQPPYIQQIQTYGIRKEAAVKVLLILPTGCLHLVLMSIL